MHNKQTRHLREHLFTAIWADGRRFSCPLDFVVQNRNCTLAVVLGRWSARTTTASPHSSRCKKKHRETSIKFSRAMHHSQPSIQPAKKAKCSNKHRSVKSTINVEISNANYALSVRFCPLFLFTSPLIDQVFSGFYALCRRINYPTTQRPRRVDGVDLSNVHSSRSEPDLWLNCNRHYRPYGCTV